MPISSQYQSLSWWWYRDQVISGSIVTGMVRVQGGILIGREGLSTVLVPIEDDFIEGTEPELGEYHVGRIETMEDVYLSLTEVEQIFGNVVDYLNETPWREESINSMQVRDAKAEALDGERVFGTPLFDFSKLGLDLRLGLRAPHDAGEKIGGFSLDASLGGSQMIVLGGNAVLLGIDNLLAPEPFNLLIELNEHTLTLGSAFNGPKVVFLGGFAAISFVQFASGSIVAMGNDW